MPKDTYDESEDPRKKLNLKYERSCPRKIGLFCWRHLRYLLITNLWVVVLFGVVLYYLIAGGVSAPSGKCLSENTQTAIAVLAAVIALLHLRQNAKIHRAQFVSSQLTRFYTDEDLWSTYNELVYCYSDKSFEKIDELSIKKGYIKDSIKRFRRGEYSYEPPLYVDHWDKSKYHPWLFQRSDEEKRLDALLGFITGVEYYCAKGLISIPEVYKQMGHHLLILNERKVMKQYFQANEFGWQQEAYNRSRGSESPLKGVRDLLDCTWVYDRILMLKGKPSALRGKEDQNECTK